jgi:hypothetical protein
MVCAGAGGAGESVKGLAGERVKRKHGREIRAAGVFEDMKDGCEGGGVVGEIGETDDAPLVAGELDDEIVEATGAAGMEEEQGRAGTFEPAGGVKAAWFFFYREAQPAYDVGQPEQLILLQRPDPFSIIGQRGIDAAVAFGGAGEALVGRDDAAGGVAGIAHGAMGDMVIRLVDGRAVHMKGKEDPLLEEAGIGLVGGALDDQRQEAESGIAVLKAAAGREIGTIAYREEVKDVIVEDLFCLVGGDKGFVVEEAGGMG